MSWRLNYTQKVESILAANMGLTGNKSFLCKPTSDTNLYAEALKSIHGIDAGRIFFTLAEAEESLKSNQGDTLYVCPGEHLVTSQITWDKHQTRIVGLGGPNQRWASTTAPDGMIRLRCNTEAVTSLLNITGQYVQMHGVETINNFDTVTNVADIIIAGRNFYAEGCSFRGGNGGSTQLGANSGIPVWVDATTGKNSNMFKFKDCYIGSPGNGVRTDGPGAMYFDGGARTTFAAELISCVLAMRCETSGSAAVSLVELEQSSNDRYLLFKDCLFYNFWENLGGKLDYAVVDAETATHQILFWRCMFAGIDDLSNVATYSFSDNQATGSDGSGKATAVDATP